MKLAHRNYLGLNAKDLSSGFTTMQDSNQPAQLQGVHAARKLKFCAKQVYQLYFQEANNKSTDQTAQICRLVCAFKFECNYVRFSLNMAHKYDNCHYNALFFNVFTPWLGRSMDDTRNARY